MTTNIWPGTHQPRCAAEGVSADQRLSDLYDLDFGFRYGLIRMRRNPTQSLPARPLAYRVAGMLQAQLAKVSAEKKAAWVEYEDVPRVNALAARSCAALTPSSSLRS